MSSIPLRWLIFFAIANIFPFCARELKRMPVLPNANNFHLVHENSSVCLRYIANVFVFVHDNSSVCPRYKKTVNKTQQYNRIK